MPVFIFFDRSIEEFEHNPISPAPSPLRPRRPTALVHASRPRPRQLLPTTLRCPSWPSPSARTTVAASSSPSDLQHRRDTISGESTTTGKVNATPSRPIQHLRPRLDRFKAKGYERDSAVDLKSNAPDRITYPAQRHVAVQSAAESASASTPSQRLRTNQKTPRRQGLQREDLFQFSAPFSPCVSRIGPCKLDSLLIFTRLSKCYEKYIFGKLRTCRNFWYTYFEVLSKLN